jgi:gluconate 5-dehydrogenase
MMKNRFDVTGKVVIVTGGTKGLGEAIAEWFADAGARVALCSRNEEECQVTAKRIAGRTGAEVLGIACDVADWDAAPTFVDRVHDHFGRIDVLVNNAGVNPAPTSITDISEAMWDEVMAINLKGPMRLSSLVAPRMAALGGGSIINIGSIGGKREVPMQSPYAASKAGLINLSHTMAAEWGKLGVRVNVVNPGPFLTPLMRFGDSVQPGKMDSYKTRTILGRMGDPEEFVGAMIYLASDAATYVTGDVHDVAGGMR